MATVMQYLLLSSTTHDCTVQKLFTAIATGNIIILAEEPVSMFGSGTREGDRVSGARWMAQDRDRAIEVLMGPWG